MEWLNYHHLLNFWMVAREGSVQRASELLHVTPASVSVQVRQLEKSLGVKLFAKQGRGLVLTEMGKEVLEYAEDIFSTGRELLEMLKGKPMGKPLELRVGIRDVMPKLVAYQLLQPAILSDPSMRLICHEGKMADLVADLAIHKLDVVLCDTALDPLYRVQAHSYKLGSSEVSIVGHPDLAKRFRNYFPRSLDQAPFLLPTKETVLRRQLDRWFTEMNVIPSIRGEFADSAMLKIAGRNGLGLFAIPTIVEKEVRQLYGLITLGQILGIQEQFFAVSIDRKIKHPGVLAICKAKAH
jgi:LysR family transcriptional regulator, transcriptional activator of nhaA